jgi:hypothetical protein
MRVLPLLVIVALGASLAGCAGGPTTSGDGNAGGNGDGTSSDGGGTDDGGTGLPDPCALATTAEVEAAQGGTVADGVETDPGPSHYAFGLGRQCVWIPDNTLSSPIFLTLYTYSADGWDEYKVNQQSYSSYHDVAGIGDEALAAGATQIGVHQGDLVLDVQMAYDTAQDPAGEPRLHAFAEMALGRL